MSDYLEVEEKRKAGHDTFVWVLSNDEHTVKVQTNAFDDSMTVRNKTGVPTSLIVQAKNIVEEER